MPDDYDDLLFDLDDRDDESHDLWVEPLYVDGVLAIDDRLNEIAWCDSAEAFELRKKNKPPKPTPEKKKGPTRDEVISAVKNYLQQLNGTLLVRDGCPDCDGTLAVNKNEGRCLGVCRRSRLCGEAGPRQYPSCGWKGPVASFGDDWIFSYDTFVRVSEFACLATATSVER